MEIIIIISVLSTLGVVAVVTAIVVAFRLLKGKVDVEDYSNTVADISMSAEQGRDEIMRDVERNDNNTSLELERLSNELTKHLDDVYTQIDRVKDETARFVDSRCDKLDTKIQGLENEIDEMVTQKSQ